MYLFSFLYYFIVKTNNKNTFTKNSLYLVKNNDIELNNINDFTNFLKANYKKIENNTLGCDMRNNSDKEVSINKISEIFYKKKILDDLMSNKNNIFVKVEISQKYLEENDNKYAINLNNGGLFNDWNFTMLS